MISHFKLCLDGFHYHNGVVDYGTDGKHKGKQGEQIDSEACNRKECKCSDDGNED